MMWTTGKYLGMLLAFGIAASSQSPQPGSQDYTINSITWLLQGKPQVVGLNSLSATHLDNPGPCAYYYWVVARFTIGNAAPSGPSAITNGSCTLVNGNRVGWAAVAGATGYDVLRTSTPQIPSGACACAIAANVSITSATDTGTTSAYTVTTFDPLAVSCALDFEPTGTATAALAFHGCPISGSPTGPAGGNLSGSYPNPIVAQVNSVSYPAGPGTNTVPVVTAPNTITYEKVPNAVLQNTSTTVNGQPCTLGAGCTVTAAPSGTAGGNLSGSYPNPAVSQVNSVSYPAGPATNTVPVVTGPNTVTYEQLPNAALQNPSTTVNGQTCTLGASCTVPIPTLTLKLGSGGGNYSTASTTYVRVDSTNLAFTVTIPTGWKLLINASGQLMQSTAAAAVNVALADGVADNAGILLEAGGIPAPSGAGANLGWALTYIVNGDGASHTINLQFRTIDAADAALIINASATNTASMTFLLTPSN